MTSERRASVKQSEAYKLQKMTPVVCQRYRFHGRIDLPRKCDAIRGML